MIVELAGLPGSGKSTIARRLAHHQISVHRQVLAPSWLGLIRHPARGVWESVNPNGIGRGSGWPAWPMLWLRALGQRAIGSRAGRVHLLEEGITHYLWRAMFLHPSLTEAPWAALLVQPHLLVVLEVEPEIRLSRLIGKRNKGKVNRALAASGIDGEVWQRGDELFERLLAEAEKSRRVVRVSTGGNVDEAMERVWVATDELS